MSLRILSGIGEVADQYDGFILDVWGVLHDGAKPFPGVIDALTRMKALGKRTAVLSNAPRRAETVARRVAEIGIPRDLYDHIHSSGEEAWRHLSNRDDPFFRELGKRCYFIGPKRDDPMLEGLNLKRVDDIAQAEFLLAVGPEDWEESLAPFEDMLKAARARDLPMVCANADLVVMHQGRRSICAGAMAEYYERLGGRVRWHGKPYLSVYETCFELLGIKDHKRILALGDSLRTDIAGAKAAGIDSVLVASGIHAEEFGIRAGEFGAPAGSSGLVRLDPARIEKAAAASGLAPIGAMAALRW
jgi:HAD superfamily hydrolase (TIGR01459 family)